MSELTEPLYIVMFLQTKITVTQRPSSSGGEGDGSIGVSWEVPLSDKGSGIYGVLPVFKSKEDAERFAGEDGEILEIMHDPNEESHNGGL